MEWNAELYDEQHGYVGAYGEALVQLVREEAERRGEEAGALRILDVGCGTGANLDALAEVGAVTGVDASPAMVERARRDHPGVEVVEADACALPFHDAFDVAFSNAVFHWIPDQVALLKSVAGALATGGLLVAEMGAHGNIARIEEGYAQALRKHSGDYAGRFCFPQEPAYRRLLGIAGFEVESMEAFDRPTPLAGGRDGLRLFAEQFFAKSLGLYRDEDRAAVLDDFERACEDELWDAGAGCWTADYRRLRFTARKVRAVRGAGGMGQLNVLGS
ncbi:methyltransferase type 11 [Gordonibacter sp. 28C]|uniref:class I SAM-dependent methyltransferase n=1 Tax=Gordonibacter sp. 28C TaxID=2078569 RepID=UPI000DF81ECD|nr:class I SAM-dependent methyltransferase [Gordonibacter sp. 28C]RDB61803.1 methyltransferase type 11 [Gordonibacter sp. 28C]